MKGRFTLAVSSWFFIIMIMSMVPIMDALAPPLHSGNNSNSKPNHLVNRRHAVMGWIGAIVGSTATSTSILNRIDPDSMIALAADMDGLNVDSFLKTGKVPNPMGVSGQSGKSRPETGVILRDGSDVSRDPRTGDVLAEIVVQGKQQSQTVVLASYSSPWPLATGTVFDVECRDSKTGDGAFLTVTSSVNGKTLEQLSDAFFMDNLIRRDGRLSFYGSPTDVKITSSQFLMVGNGNDNDSSSSGAYKVMDLSFSIISQATQTEIPRRARLAVTIPSDSDQAVMLVASASANRWNKGSDKLVATTIQSFRAVPAPATNLKIRAKPKRT